MPDRPPAPINDPKDADLLALRERLRQARSERGRCPSWDELKADLVPGGAHRPGREERQAHLAICPYCGEHEREWRNSFDFDADRLAAIEKGVATGILGIARTLGLGGPGGQGKGTKTAAPAPAPAEEDSVLPAPVHQQRMYTPPADIAEPALAIPVAAPDPAGLARMIVVEMADGRTPPPSVYLCAQVLEAEVAQVDSIDELVGDPDLSLVCGVVLGGSRQPDSWPDAVRHARRIVPKRPVVLLATYGVEAPAGARRALGESLQSESDPAERLLLALDPELR
jgi:hypothetical protein